MLLRELAVDSVAAREVELASVSRHLPAVERNNIASVAVETLGVESVPRRPDAAPGWQTHHGNRLISWGEKYPVLGLLLDVTHVDLESYS